MAVTPLPDKKYNDTGIKLNLVSKPDRSSIKSISHCAPPPWGDHLDHGGDPPGDIRGSSRGSSSSGGSFRGILLGDPPGGSSGGFPGRSSGVILQPGDPLGDPPGIGTLLGILLGDPLEDPLGGSSWAPAALPPRPLEDNKREKKE
jgi:hypothetical protein